MTYEYTHQPTEGILSLVVDEPFSQRYREKIPLLTILWNRHKDTHVVVDGSEVLFPTDHVLTLMAGQVVSSADDAQFTSWQFNREFYCIIDHDEEVSCVGLLFYGGSELAILKLDESESHKFDLLTQVFEDEFGNRDNIQGEMLRMLLKRLIIKLTRLRKDHPDAASVGGEDLDVVRQFNLLVEKNFRKIHQVQEYAELMYRSPKTLSNAFSAYKNTSPLQVIQERLILEAQRLLLYSSKPVKEIAYDLGFDEVSHFNRMFRKYNNESPGMYRKNAALTSA